MLDLRIVGGTLVTARGQARQDVGVADRRTYRRRITRTILRGQTVYQDGQITAEPGTGRFARPD